MNTTQPAPRIALIFPPDTVFPVVHGKWRRLGDGRILAQFTRAELQEAYTVAEAIRNRVIQDVLIEDVSS